MLRFEQVVTAAGEAPFDLEVASGTGAVLIGPSGGARTRLLASAAGLAQPLSGRVLLDDRPVPPAAAGFVDEDRALLGRLTAAENVAARVLVRGSLGDEDWAAIDGLLRRLGLPESGVHNLAEQLSGGQQQRVAIGRALFGSPELLCLDDPVSELDGASADLVWSVVEDAVRSGATLLVGLPEPDPRVPAAVIRDVTAVPARRS